MQHLSGQLFFQAKFMYKPNNGGEVTSYLGFDEGFVEGRVWSRDHERRQQAQSESFEGICDAKKRNRNKSG